MVVPYPSGGPTDVLARIVSAKLSQLLGQSVLVDNRAGASGMIGAAEVARAAADGYTLLSNASIHVINPSLHRRMPFDALGDFTPITQWASVPLVLVVNTDLPVHTVSELIDYARARPDALSYASSGSGAAPHLAAEAFKQATGISMQHIPYKGSAPALTDLVAGSVQLMFDSMPSAMPYVKSGRIRPIAVTTAQRVPALAELPTVGEAGVAGFDISTWYGVWAPRATPASIAKRLHAEVVKALALPDVRERFAALGADPVGSSPDQFAAFCRNELAKWAQVVQRSGAQVD
jgi:tripartite-type tricarboxylate transporter receptor subunit TctC